MTEDEKKKVLEKILTDYTKDTSKENSTLRTLVVIVGIIALIAVAGCIILAIHTQNIIAENAKYTSDKMADLLSEYDWEVEYQIDSTNNKLYSGNIVVGK